MEGMDEDFQGVKNTLLRLRYQRGESPCLEDTLHLVKKTTLYFDKQIERILPIVTLSNSSVILNELTTNDILIREVLNPSLHVLAVQYQQLTKKDG